jgi:hypothetical protein
MHRAERYQLVISIDRPVHMPPADGIRDGAGSAAPQVVTGQPRWSKNAVL